MIRLIIVGGVLFVSVGMALIVPAVVEWLDRATLAGAGMVMLALGVTLVLSGVTAIRYSFVRRSGTSMPTPVRSAVTGNILFLAFFALEISDGLIRQGGAIAFLSSGLFLPTLFLLYGLVAARGWAWWTARVVAALFTLWFLGFMVVIPFTDLRAGGGPVPLWGRLYMVGVSLMLASILAYAFRALGRPEARDYFGLLREG